MALDSKDKAWLVPDAMNQIKSTLNREQDFETNLLAVSLDQGLGEITLADRDEAVYRLRFLKFWFGYPSIVFLTAVSVLDRFLIKMKVQRKYLQCLVISCLYIAVKLGHYNINTKNLVTLSQSKCSVKDMERMSEIVKQKLNLQSEKQFSVFDYLSQFLNLLKTVAVNFKIKSLFNVILKRKTLLSRLEIIMCDSECASWKPTIITLALIQCEIERFFSNQMPSKSSYYSLKMLHLLRTVVDLQLICLIKPIEFHSCHKRILHILGEYDNHSRIHSSHNLKWYFQTQTYTIKHYRNYFYMRTILEEKEI